MRQGQQNRRGRGRGRKPQNPLARNYESNGPDVKIRGTAAHIAEKYMSLARDALASGDMVTAESYLQHAEHYNRIIMAAQQQQLGPQHGGQPHQSEGPNGGGFKQRWSSEEESAEAETAEASGGGNARPNPGPERGRARHGGNGSDAVRDANGAETAETKSPDESETTPDAVS